MDHAFHWIDSREGVGDLALFLDFDGTLAPIVERPGEAEPLDGVVELIEAIGRVLPVAVVSGRGLDDVVDRLGARGIDYAGSHGMEHLDAQGNRETSKRLERFEAVIDDVEAELRERFSEVPRIEIERKRFGVAVHFRRRPEAREIVESALEKIVDDYGDLRIKTGKMVREIMPDLDIDKGTALRAIRDRIDADDRRCPVYIGDDTTDEDAFEALGDEGVGILVDDEPGETAATRRVDDPREVRELLRRIVERLEVEATTPADG